MSGDTARKSARATLVIGMEKSGLASVEFLIEHGANVTAADVRPLDQIPRARETLTRWQVPFHLQSEIPFEDFDLIVLSPGVPSDLPGLSGRDVVGEVELGAPDLRGPTIGITGTNGKTTTTAMVGHILKTAGVPAQVGGNIGTPVTAMTKSSRPDQWNVLELSSFQLETIRTFRAHVGVCLNVTQNHLDRHHTFENYASAKGNLFRTQSENDFAVLNENDPECVKFAALASGTVVWFNRTPLPLAELTVRGQHNIENAMAAAAAARLAGVTEEAIAEALSTFRAVEHRLEFVRNLRGVDFYNDSKATSVDATLKALESFAGGLWVILGGKDKGSDYTPLRAPLKAKAHAALLIGEAATKIAADLGDAVPLIASGTLDRAVREASERAVPGDTVLLAPACASFDQFKSFEHRGKVFKELVHGTTA
ncbi:MAG: UDP-N-acetylmuramoyl-L-alanine--D-glutamate ligase [Acidobacteriota bacterium]|nr:UDP-N-acetylmuramoyl-L-alanine--D-glutamate ligase [Acidobacteriota bacterium]